MSVSLHSSPCRCVFVPLSVCFLCLSGSASVSVSLCLSPSLSVRLSPLVPGFISSFSISLSASVWFPSCDSLSPSPVSRDYSWPVPIRQDTVFCLSKLQPCRLLTEDLARARWFLPLAVLGNRLWLHLSLSLRVRPACDQAVLKRDATCFSDTSLLGFLLLVVFCFLALVSPSSI